MSNLLIKPYEISVWEDYEDGQGKPCEKKIVIIGSDTMTSPFKAVSPALRQNVNGTKTLTFSMYYTCYDEVTQRMKPNPFLPYMSNERKIKLRYDGKWYDFIIKNIQENSTNKIINYTCKDLFINELGKTGFNLEFHTDLMNNQGTIKELAEKILSESDWKIGKIDLIQQTVEEPLYEATLTTTINPTKIITDNDGVNSIPSGEKIYIFYSSYSNKTDYIQFIYKPAPDNYNNNNSAVTTETLPLYYELEDGIILNTKEHQYTISVDWNESGDSGFIGNKAISNYRADKLVKKQKSTYDAKLERQVYEYTDGATTYNGFIETNYIDALTVENLFVNPNAFTNNNGWYSDNETIINLALIPEIVKGQNSAIDQWDSTAYLKVQYNNGAIIRNTGLISNRSKIHEIKAGDKYVFRIKFGTSDGSSFISQKSGITMSGGRYNLSDGKHTITERIFSTSFNDVDEANNPYTWIDEGNGYIHKVVTAHSDYSYSGLLDIPQLGFFLEFSSGGTYYIEDAQFFIYKEVTRTSIEEGVNEKPSSINGPNSPGFSDLNEEKLKFDSNSGNYFYEENGVNATGWKQIDGYWYFFSVGYGNTTIGAMLKGWIKDRGKDYYLNINSGKMHTGWFQESESSPIYYFGTDGAMISADVGTLDKLIDNTTYTFDATGALIGNGMVTELEMALPGELFEAYVENTYWYYRPDGSYSNIDDLIPSYKTINAPHPDLKPIYSNNYEKVRSITNSESNRFNLIQDICEIFECWANFRIEHEEDGRIKVVQEQNSPSSSIYRQQKFIDFLEYVGQDNHRGFKYGINLKSIQRTLDSEAHVSKLIVKNNSNEFAEDGFCSIARASENPYKENFLLNFDYYINHGLLDADTVNKDLYDIGNGYLYKLQTINSDMDILIEERSKLETEKMKWEAEKEVCILGQTKASEEMAEKNSELIEYTTLSYQYLKAHPDDPRWDDEKAVEICTAIAVAGVQEKKFQERLDAANAQLGDFDAKTGLYGDIANIEEKLEMKLVDKEELNKAFYSKYSRFLQEGSWISEDYYDDNLYYLDAKGVLHTSAFPKVTYNISVLELSQVPGYENYIYSIGDKTYIEDTEFFGWVYIDGIQTPFKEEVVLSEIIEYLEEPEKNSIRIQNYKTQFDDLFQRVAASVQNLQLQSGAYERAANAIETNGVINFDLLQNTIVSGDIFFQTSGDKTIIWDNYGIKSSQPSDLDKQLRISNGALLVTLDGGKTWQTVITPNGINASYIRAGKLDASMINIVDGNAPAFSWTKDGINAFKSIKISNGENNQTRNGYDLGSFVRFDQYGVYAIDKTVFGDYYSENFDPSDYSTFISPEHKIQNYATFSLTRRGFTLKTDYLNTNNKGKFSITSDDDLQIFDKDGVERIKIGRLIRDNEETYGMQISKSYFDVSKKEYTNIPVLASYSNYDNGNLVLSGLIGIRDDLVNNTSNGASFGVIEKYTDGIDADGNEKIKYVKILSATPRTGRTAFNDEKLNALKNETLAIFDDGTIIANRLRAKGADIEGTINATGGKIGNLTIQALEEKVNSMGEGYKTIELINLIPTFNGIISTDTQISYTVKTTGFIDEPVYRWKKTNDFNNWSNIGSSKTLNYTVSINDFNDNNTCYIQVEAIQNEEVQASNILEIVKDEKVFNNQFTSLTVDKIRVSKDLGKEPITSFSPEIIDCEVFPDNYSVIFTDIEGKRFEEPWDVVEITENNINHASSLVSTWSSGTDGIIKLQFDLQSILSMKKGTDINTLNYRIIDLIQSKDEFNIIVSSTKEGITYRSIAAIRRKVFEGWAKVNIEQDNITIAVDDTELLFDSTGLTLENGKFKIVDNDEAKTVIFGVDKNTDRFTFRGDIYANNGFFKGTIEALSGSFNGKVTASEGRIGGISFSGTELKLGDMILHKAGEMLESGNVLAPYNHYDYIAGLKKFNDEDENGNAIISEKIGFLLNGNGEVIANDLRIGGTSYIAESLSVGGGDNSMAVTIKAPQWNGDTFIETSNDAFSITNTGVVRIGNLILDGSNADGKGGVIKSSNGLESSSGWSINNEEAIFNDIVASGTFKASVFEAQKITVNGGKTIFKTGAMIEDFSFSRNNASSDINNPGTYIITLKDKSVNTGGADNFSVEDYILITVDSGTQSEIAKIVGIGNNTLEINPLSNDIDVTIKYNMILDLGKFDLDEETGYSTGSDWVIGVNSTDTEGNLGLRRNALTISELKVNEQNGNVIAENKVILGDLHDKIPNAAGTHGLYASSVYLTGTLTTEYSDNNKKNKYAGVNTLNGLPFNKQTNISYIVAQDLVPGQIYYYLEDGRYKSYEYKSGDNANRIYYEKNSDSSPIVFWAGSDGNTGEAIQNSPFQVTSNGTVYATQGYFKGSIITESILEAAVIKTSIMEGVGNTPALKIRGIGEEENKAISFVDEKDNSIFSLTSKKLNFNGTMKVGNNVEFDPSKNSYRFSHLYINDFNNTDNVARTAASVIGPQTFGFTSNFENDFYEQNFYSKESLAGYIGFNNIEDNSDKITINVGNSQLLKIGKDRKGEKTKVEAMVNDFYFDNNLDFGGKMNLVKVNDGYDLYF